MKKRKLRLNRETLHTLTSQQLPKWRAGNGENDGIATDEGVVCAVTRALSCHSCTPLCTEFC